MGDLSVKKGVYVMFSAQTLHNDPELWSEPDKFDPERYTHTYIIREYYTDGSCTVFRYVQ